MYFGTVDLVVFVGGEGDRLMGREGALHYFYRAKVIRYLSVLGAVEVCFDGYTAAVGRGRDRVFS